MQPFVTVIMPIRNEEGFIQRSLGAVLEQDYPHDHLEVLVADGMSTDKTREVIQAMPTDVPVKIIDNPGKIVPTGFNLALKQAQGDVIVRVDGHTIIEPDYVSECIRALMNSGADNVGGRMDAVGTSDWGKAIAAATSSAFGVGGARFHYSQKEEWVDTVYMGAWRKEVFERIGGFDEQFVRNQDDEFNYRLRASGGKILLSPRIRSTYFNRDSLGKLWRQYYEYGLYKVRVMQKHAGQMRLRQFVPPAFVAFLVGGAVIGLLNRWLQLLWLLGLGFYAVVNVLVSLRTARADQVSQPWMLPVVYFILHAGYGTGFLVGLWRFYIQNPPKQ